jgi:hypothetical protein
VTQEHLDLSDIDAIIEQMAGEAVAERVQGHAFLDPRRVGRFMESKRLPENRGEFEYCIRNLGEPYARVARESELTKA